MKLLGLCGSLRRHSSNASLLRAAQRISEPPTSITIFESLADLPLFNPDLEHQLPASVMRMSQAVEASDGLLIASPEYAHTMSGVIKNALDWMVKNTEIWGKPVAVLSASTTLNGGNRAIAAVMHPLVAIKAEIVSSAAVSAVTQKLDTAGEIIDAEALRQIQGCVLALVAAARHQAATSEHLTGLSAN